MFCRAGWPVQSLRRKHGSNPSGSKGKAGPCRPPCASGFHGFQKRLAKLDTSYTTMAIVTHAAVNHDLSTLKHRHIAIYTEIFFCFCSCSSKLVGACAGACACDQNHASKGERTPFSPSCKQLWCVLELSALPTSADDESASAGC